MDTIIDLSSPRPADRATKQKMFWSCISSLQNDSRGVSHLRSEGKIHSSVEEKAGILNQQFMIYIANQSKAALCPMTGKLQILLHFLRKVINIKTATTQQTQHIS